MDRSKKTATEVLDAFAKECKAIGDIRNNFGLDSLSPNQTATCLDGLAVQWIHDTILVATQDHDVLLLTGNSHIVFVGSKRVTIQWLLMDHLAESNVKVPPMVTVLNLYVCRNVAVHVNPVQFVNPLCEIQTVEKETKRCCCL
jgi:hypothetical protein